MKSTNKTWAKRSAALSLAIVALIAAPLASAQDDAFWFVGANIGKANTDMNSSRISPRLQTMGFTTTSIYEDDDATAFKALAGYHFNKNFAIEASMFDLGDYGFQAVMTPSANLEGKIRPMGYGLDLVGILPLASNNSVFARVGINYAEMREQFSARNLPFHPFAKSDNNDTNLKVGVGFQHDFTPTVAMRVEFERYHLDESIGVMHNVNMFSVGVVYRLGYHEAYVAPAPAPAVVAAPAARPTPPPAPTPPPPPPPKPAPVKITLEADSVFDFDSSVIKPVGKQALDKMANDLKALDYSVITVTGHSDRIGAAKYNQKLSERRAQSVRNYLVETARIPSGKITATGVDGTQPVTRTDQCTMTAKAALIVCLQPDRRVEVEVVGTK